MNENYSLKELNEWADKVIDGISKWADEMNKAFNGTPTSIKIEKLDFSEHDKVLEDKIARLESAYHRHRSKICDLENENHKLKQRIAELESKNNQLTESILRKETKIHELESKETETQSGIDTSTPIDCANSLINHLTHLEAFLIAPERYERTFDIDELEQIAEHLLVYCKHNKESEE